eukprot:752506-Hanusia_phi.AAC.11
MPEILGEERRSSDRRDDARCRCEEDDKANHQCGEDEAVVLGEEKKRGDSATTLQRSRRGGRRNAR